MNKQKLIEFLDFLIKANRTFNHRKEILHEYNRMYNLNYSYEAFKSLWQDNKPIAQRLNKLVGEETIPYNPFEPIVIGNTIAKQQVDVGATIEEIMALYEQKSATEFNRSIQTITFNERYFALVNMADIHFGDYINMQLLKRDSEIVANTPGMYVNFLGDLTDNFVGDWTNSINTNSKITIKQQMALAKWWLEMMASSLVAFTTGNHDEWTQKLAGFDYLFETLNNIKQTVLYDAHEQVFNIAHFDRNYIVKVRHDWPGKSQSNITYGIEADYKKNEFDIGIGGHTHKAGLYRQFLGRDEKTCWAIQCGSYKQHDPYARQLGFQKPNQSTSVVLLFDSESPNGVHAIADIPTAAKYLNLLNNQ